MIERLMLLLVLILIVIIIRRLWGVTGRTPAAPPPPPANNPQPYGNETVRCATCGVHVPRSEALRAQGKYYCDEHAPRT